MRPVTSPERRDDAPVERSYLSSDGAALRPILFTKSPLLVYASKDLIALVQASSLNLVTTLAFWDAYPSLFGTDTFVQHISVDTARKWIIAAAGTRIAIWALSSLEETKWHVHSNITTNQPVTALECHDGRLFVGSSDGLIAYSSKVLDGLVTWTLIWRAKTSQPDQISLSPSTTLLATRSKNISYVNIWLAASGRLVQRISHPRPLINISWRSPPSNKEEYILYTTTSDSALRIFLPVLDTPRHLQLHATIDPYSFLPSSLATNKGSPVMALHRDSLRAVIGNALREPRDKRTSFGESQRRRLTEVYEEGWDLFARILDDGSIVVQAVANIDRRPPTLLKQFTLLHSLFDPPLESLPTALLLLPSAAQLNLITNPPIVSHSLLPLPFFDAKKDGLRTIAAAPESGKYGHLPITHISRSPEGHAVAVMRRGASEIWKVKKSGDLRLISQFETVNGANILVFHSGESVAVYDPDERALSVQMSSTSPPKLSLPALIDLFLIPPNHDHITCLVGITESFQVLQIHAIHPPDPALVIHSNSSLPNFSKPNMIVPVDPMIWNKTASELLLSVSEEGDLEFWAPEGRTSWKRTGHVATGKKNIIKARCSSAKKTVLVVRRPEGDEVSIWDSKESQFSSGLEHLQIYPTNTPVIDLDWTATPDGQSVLAVGFPSHVLLLYQQRMTYFDQGSGWGVFGRIEIGRITKHPIADSIWISRAQMLTGAGHQMIQARPGFSLQDGTTSRDLFETVARKNGPLPHYHPQMLLQCLLWEKIKIIKQIIGRLARDLKYLTPDERAVYEMEPFPVDAFLWRDTQESLKTSLPNKNSLFDDAVQPDLDDDIDGFSPAVVSKLVADLEETPLQDLGENENEQLLVLLQTTLSLDEHRRALDADGLRYLISIRLFYLINERARIPRSTPSRDGVTEKQRGFRERIRYRDMVWAFHSSTQEVLLNVSTAACGGKMTWNDARALGIFLWLNSLEAVKDQFEVIARNQYMSGEDRDPSACCLFYFALGKVRLVLGLWRQAAWHPDQGVMLKFLANDFDLPRWRTAALKNAFALLGKRRFEMAAAFFLLGGSLRDAANVCLKQMGDFQLAVALARVVEGDNGPVLIELLKTAVIPMAFREGNRWLGSWAFWKLNRRDLSVRILVTPLKEYATMLHVESFESLEAGESNYDDPSLALLFSRLKSMSLQTIKGSNMIPGQQEFDFVLQMARVFCRMGCHPLALDLVADWSFDPPEPMGNWAFGQRRDSSSIGRSTSPRSPSLRRSKSRRHSVIDIDLDIEQDPSDPHMAPAAPSHLTSVPEVPELEIPPPTPTDAANRGRAGFGGLVQTAKRDVQVPEFDMSAFGF
ncbi:regulator of (H+)-ATPase in vacuolar membrane [Serendipita sp. 399]|nr:regulator of (H+)-ATPase in vacuolar membrane [Serendipita sp. 399]